MRTLIAAILAVWSSIACAETVLVYYWNENTRVILTANPCPIEMKSAALIAIAQRRDSDRLQYGCYTYEPAPGLVRIQWSADPNNFDVLNVEGFRKEEMGKEEPNI